MKDQDRFSKGRFQAGTSHFGRACIVALLVFVVGSLPAAAQKNSPDIPAVSNVVAISGATIVQSPGKTLENATLVFRNGVITYVGTKATIPYDAEVIDGTGMTVYAGFIDALSNVGVPTPENAGPQEAVPDRSNPTFDQAGIQPQTDVRALLSPSDASVDAYRKLGFTSAQSVPLGRMFPGQGSVVLLTGDDADAMVLKSNHSQFFQFESARGVYPGTLLGIMAKFRRMYIEATRRMKVDAMYAANPAGMTRPLSDEVHDALFPVVSGTQPLFVYASDVLGIHRALALKNEFGFNMVLLGMSEGFDTVEKAKASGVPLALTLDLPENPEWAAGIKADSLEQIIASYDGDTRTDSFRDVQTEKRNLEAKQLLSRKQYAEMPKMYADAGVPFAFTSFGVKTADIATNLREFVKGGLSEDGALAALTTTPARMLGLSSSMGTIEVGKMANVVVATGNMFDEKSAVRYVFVNGMKYEYEASEKKSEVKKAQTDAEVNNDYEN
ncbi:amidohydrolase family protein [bacterium]|nr:amidohydrolase family protein [bacterium]